MKTPASILLLLIFVLLPALAQNEQPKAIDSMLTSAKDSLIVLDSTLIAPLVSDTLSAPSLEMLIYKGRNYSLQANEIIIELQKNLDTTRLAEEIPVMTMTLSQLEERAKDPNTKFNFRYINALLRVLKTTEENNQELDKIVQARLDQLHRLDSLLGTIKKDDFFKYKIRDTGLLPMYTAEIDKLKSNVHQLDSMIYREELQAARYQSQLSSITIGIKELIRYVDSNKSELERNLLKKEINYIWESYAIPSPKSILQITLDSLRLNYLLLLRQLRIEPFDTGLAVIILIAGFLLVKRTLHRIRKDKEYGKIILRRLKYLPSRPFSSVMVAMLPLVLFLFDRGSVALVTFFLFLVVLFSTILIQATFSRGVLIRWLILVAVFLFFSISNLYWEIAYQERMYFQIGNLIALYILWQIPKRFKSDTKGEIKFLMKLRTVTMVFIGTGVLANVLARYSLAKIISVAGVVGFVHAITLYFFIKVIMEIIYISVESKKEADHFTSYIDFKGIQKRLKGFFIFLATLFWILILLHNLALSDYVLDALSQFLSKTRTLGSATFTFSSILLFCALVYGAYILANNIAYFASLKDQKNSGNRKKRLGSSVLLIRLAVLIVGFFLAATAADIPLDKVTLVLGALSVGIGFGLQTIINNLVSGVILAFERPIQIGDDIEVGTMSGQVKEVGIRASKILSYDGAEVIIPNGDLLSQSLINWTLSDKRRRIELMINVAYDSDMQQVRSLLTEVLQRDRIVKSPPPRVLMQQFSERAVEFRILFWIESMDHMLEMRNEVMNAIFQAFRENGIEIPLPRRDLHIRSLPTQTEGGTQKNPPKTDSGDNVH